MFCGGDGLFVLVTLFSDKENKEDLMKHGGT
jgi:hypothetical protein